MAQSCLLRVNTYTSNKQTTGAPITDSSTRTITVETKHDLYDPARELGDSYTLILWYPNTAQLGDYNVTVTSDPPTTAPQYEIWQDNTLKTVGIKIKETIGKSKSIVVTAKPTQSDEGSLGVGVSRNRCK